MRVVVVVVVVAMVVVAAVGNVQKGKLYKKVPRNFTRSTHEFPVHSKIQCGAACSQTEYCEGFDFHQGDKFCSLFDNEVAFHTIEEDVNHNDGFTVYWTEDQLRFTQKGIKKYKFIKKGRMQTDARNFCRFLGGRLLLPKSEEEQKEAVEFINEAGANYYLWIGITDMDQDGVYVDMETDENLTYENWISPDPNYVQVQHCGDMDNQGGWYNTECWHNLSFVCEAAVNH